MPFDDSPFTVTRIDPIHWRLVEPLVYRGRDDAFRVPVGFVTDFATVPRLLRSFASETGTWTLAAVLHDYLCEDLGRYHRQRAALGPDGFFRLTPPYAGARDTDGLFRRVMREQHVGFLRRWLMWTGVRWGALANPARRAGWWRDAPPVLAISALVLAPIAVLLVLTLELAR
jgi:hypothetical protein